MESTRPSVILRLLILTTTFFVSSYQCPVPCECDNVTNTIDCSSRGLVTVPEFRIIPLPRIEVLDLSGNELVVLNSSDFRSLLGLSIDTIDVSFNRIALVVGEFSNGHEAIGYKALNLSNNLLESFPRNIVPNVHQRAELIIDVSNNFLQELPARMFAGADDFYPGFQFIAGGNVIRTIHPDAFAGTTITDAILDFRDNNLSSIPEELKLPVGVRSIKLSGNPWSCDCTFKWITGSLLGNYSVTSSPVCSSPGGVRGRLLFSLSKQEFACAPSANETDVDTVSEFGGNILLRCPVTSDPPNPQTTWEIIQLDGTANPWSVEVAATQLNVTHVKTNDVVYRCTASNTAGSVTVQLRINVTSPGEEDGNSKDTSSVGQTGEDDTFYITEIYEEIVTSVENVGSSRDPVKESDPTRNQPVSTSDRNVCVSQSALTISVFVIIVVIFFSVTVPICTLCFWRWLLPRERKRKFQVRSRTERADFAFVGPGIYNQDEEDFEDETSQNYVSETSTAL